MYPEGQCDWDGMGQGVSKEASEVNGAPVDLKDLSLKDRSLC